MVFTEAEPLSFCVRCGSRLVKGAIYCSACGGHIESDSSPQVSVTISSMTRKPSHVSVGTACAYVPSAVFQNESPANDELEKAVMTTMAFRQIAEPIFRRQFAAILIGALAATLFIVIAVVFASYAILAIAVCGLLPIIYGMRLKPHAELVLTKAYSTLALIPFGTSKLVFDMNECLGHEQFDFVTLPIPEISSKLRDLPENLTIENEKHLFTSLKGISRSIRNQKKESISLPLVAKEHSVIACVLEALDHCVDGRPVEWRQSTG